MEPKTLVAHGYILLSKADKGTCVCCAIYQTLPLRLASTGSIGHNWLRLQTNQPSHCLSIGAVA